MAFALPVIAAMTVGKDVVMLFTDVVNCIQTQNIELKKLVYLYLINYAKSQPDLAILAVNTFVKDTQVRHRQRALWRRSQSALASRRSQVGGSGGSSDAAQQSASCWRRWQQQQAAAAAAVVEARSSSSGSATARAKGRSSDLSRSRSRCSLLSPLLPAGPQPAHPRAGRSHHGLHPRR